MQRASLTVDPDHRGDLSSGGPRVFCRASGRCVYTGIFEPGHPEADENGFRRTCSISCEEMGVSGPLPRRQLRVRLRWEDGVGPGEQRPGGSTAPGTP